MTLLLKMVSLLLERRLLPILSQNHRHRRRWDEAKLGDNECHKV